MRLRPPNTQFQWVPSSIISSYSTGQNLNVLIVISIAQNASLSWRRIASLTWRMTASAPLTSHARVTFFKCSKCRIACAALNSSFTGLVGASVISQSEWRRVCNGKRDECVRLATSLLNFFLDDSTPLITPIHKINEDISFTSIAASFREHSIYFLTFISTKSKWT